MSGLERGDWTTVFYRGSQEVIGATKMDEKLLDELRRQEEVLDGTEQGADGEGTGEEMVQPPPELDEVNQEPRTSGQQTLMGYGRDA